MVILGLTGSIGMGKSVAAAMFRDAGAVVFDADAAVHRLIGPGGGAVDEIGTAFSGCVRDAPGGAEVDRAALGARVFGDDAATTRLEAILHPRVRKAEKAFIEDATRARHWLAVLDIPLLLETGGEDRCDAVAVVYAPAFVQAARVLTRRGMTPDRLAAIRMRQMPDAEKLRRADFRIPTGLGRALTLRRVRRIVRILRDRERRSREQA